MKFEIDSSSITFNGKGFKNFFKRINDACQKCDISYFVVGAFARDLVLENIFHQPTGIATRDIDLAILIDSWKSYYKFIDYLTVYHNFKEGETAHQYISPEGIFTDILPYGKIEENRTICFPPNFSKEINMLGFKEVYDATLLICLDKEVDIKVASIEGITILKLIAWKDRQPAQVSEKHVRDIGLILKGYFDAMIAEFAKEFSDLLDEPDFDKIVCGASALGRRLRQLATPSSELVTEIDNIFDIILKEEDNSLFITQLTNSTIWNYPFALSIIKAFTYNFKK